MHRDNSFFHDYTFQKMNVKSGFTLNLILKV